IGGHGDDTGKGIAVDSAGNAYITGEVGNFDGSFPVTAGSIRYFGGIQDAFVAKVAVDGTALVYCGLLGGPVESFGSAIAVDCVGNAYITGETFCDQAHFPVTVGPCLIYNGNGDAYVAKV